MSQQEPLRNLLKKTDAWIGLLLLVLLFYVGTLSEHSVREPISPIPASASKVVAVLTPLPTKAVYQQRLPAKKKSPYIVQEGDNFYKISLVVCNTGKYYKVLRKQSGYVYRTLRPGDKIDIECPGG